MRRLKAARTNSATTKSASPTMAADSPVSTGARRKAATASRSAWLTTGGSRGRRLARREGVEHQPALVELEHAHVRVRAHQLEVVGRHHHRHAARVDVPEQLHHAAGGALV